MAYTTVEGTVSRLNNSGNGYGVKEEQSFQGKTRTTYWSVFPARGAVRDVQVGDVVKVGGFLGTKVSERDNRYVDHTLNNAKVLESAPAQNFPTETPF